MQDAPSYRYSKVNQIGVMPSEGHIINSLRSENVPEHAVETVTELV